MSKNLPALLVALAFVATSGCGTNNGPVPASGALFPNGSSSQASSRHSAIAPDTIDTTSILEKLKKDVVIGSTVDPGNGDTGPGAISRVFENFGLKKGQLLVCNFADSAGAAGHGTTIEVLNPTPGSKPKTVVQSAKIEGCDGDAVTSNNVVFGAGLTSGRVVEFSGRGKSGKTHGSPIVAPMNDADAFCGLLYAPEDLYVSDAQTGALIKFAVGSYGNPKEIEVVSGFDVNKKSGWKALGPSGLQYDNTLIHHGSLCVDTLYVVDGVDNTVVAISNASNLLAKDEIVIKPGGKKFTCKQRKFTCASLVYSGAPLDAPYASALLPNGNLIVANTKGGNKLVELTPTGKVLATKNVDKSSTAHVFGLAASGTNDKDTVLFYSDTKDNSVHELAR